MLSGSARRFESPVGLPRRSTKRDEGDLRKMKTTVKLAALAAMLFSFALAGEAMADTLGDTLARELCRVSKGKTSSYMLSQQELLLWNGQAVSGSYTTTSAGTAYS